MHELRSTEEVPTVCVYEHYCYDCLCSMCVYVLVRILVAFFLISSFLLVIYFTINKTPVVTNAICSQATVTLPQHTGK